DRGVLAPWSQWKPRRVLCTTQPDHSDRPRVEYVVKFRQSPLRASEMTSAAVQTHSRKAAAALISEVLCHRLFAAGGISGLEARLVSVDSQFASHHDNRTDKMYTVHEGLHFGTLWRLDVENGGPSLKKEDLVDLHPVVDMWAFDSWLCN